MRTCRERLILLAVVIVCCVQAQASTCLRETAPQVESYLVTGEPEQVRQAIAAIQERADQPDSGLAAPWLAAQASMLLDIGAFDEAEARLRRAVSGWRRAGDVAAEICTRRLLIFALEQRHEPRAALAETLQAEARARDAGLDDALNKLKNRHIALLSTLNERLEEAQVMMAEVRPGESAVERIAWHQSRGFTLGDLNQHRQAAAQFEQAMRLAEAESLLTDAASARFNLASELIRIGRDDPVAVPEDRVIALLEQVVSAAHARPSTRALALRSLAHFKPPEQQSALLTECVHAAEQANDNRRKAVCLADLAELEVAANPDRALEYLAEAVAMAKTDPRALWQIQAQRLAVIWATEPPRQAFASSLRAIDGEKRLRELQMTGPARAQLIDGLSWDYRRLANRAYEHFDTHPELAGRALELLEANRALVLREQRQLQRDATDDEAITALADRINQAQKTLLDPEADAQHAERARRELKRLEAAWREASVRPPQQAEALQQEPRLNDIRNALKPDEALLSFLTLVPGQDGGWLHVLTSDTSRIYPVPAHYHLVSIAELLYGIPDWRDAAARQLLDRLAKQILAPALDELEPGIRHLLVIPDRGVERLPLEMLSGPDGEPVGIQYSIDIAPSAGIWLDARQSPGTGRGQVLALADPALPEAGYRALNTAYPAERLASLPGAVGEARQIRRLAGSNKVHLRSGPAAGEDILTGSEALAGIGLIHFATHTLIHPEAERSAILLAASENGDGLLQPREIERLELNDIAVVLASCASATGERLDNEGIISLARSFMIAGAPSVIATRWPVDDGHAQAFFQRFYWHLVGGLDQSDAMRRARADLRDSGYPERAWAAFVLYGDGRWQPLAPHRSWPAWALLMLAAGLAAVVVARANPSNRRAV